MFEGMFSFDVFVERLSTNPKNRIWTTGEAIMCKTEDAAEAVADLLEQVFDLPVVTGYYDPEEDERNNEVDEATGHYYVSVG